MNKLMISKYRMTAKTNKYLRKRQRTVMMNFEWTKTSRYLEQMNDHQ